jgi:hypothetical protein
MLPMDEEKKIKLSLIYRWKSCHTCDVCNRDMPMCTMPIFCVRNYHQVVFLCVVCASGLNHHCIEMIWPNQRMRIYHINGHELMDFEPGFLDMKRDQLSRMGRKRRPEEDVQDAKRRSTCT